MVPVGAEVGTGVGAEVGASVVAAGVGASVVAAGVGAVVEGWDVHQTAPFPQPMTQLSSLSLHQSPPCASPLLQESQLQYPAPPSMGGAGVGGASPPSTHHCPPQPPSQRWRFLLHHGPPSTTPLQPLQLQYEGRGSALAGGAKSEAANATSSTKAIGRAAGAKLLDDILSRRWRGCAASPCDSFLALLQLFFPVCKGRHAQQQAARRVVISRGPLGSSARARPTACASLLRYRRLLTSSRGDHQAIDDRFSERCTVGCHQTAHHLVFL